MILLGFSSAIPYKVPFSHFKAPTSRLERLHSLMDIFIVFIY